MSPNGFSLRIRPLVAVAALAILSVVPVGCRSRCPTPAPADASDSAAAAAGAWATVQAINRAWAVHRSLDSLRPHFHPRFVGIYPGGLRLEGAEALLNSYAEFLGGATVNWYREERPTVQVFGGDRFVVVTYVYNIEWVQRGRTLRESGNSMYSLVKEGERWLAVGQEYQPLPGPPQ